MAGFRREIGTNVEVPTFNVPQSTGDDVSDALNIASFGLNVFSQIKEREAESARLERQKELVGVSENIIKDIAYTKSQKRINAFQEQKMIEDQINQISNPMERAFVRENVVKSLTTGIYGEARKNEQAEEDALDADLRRIDKEYPQLSPSLFRGRNIASMSMDEKFEIMTEFRHLAKLDAEKQAAGDDFLANPSVRSLNAVLSAEFQSGFGKLQADLANFMTMVDKAGGSPERKEILSRGKANLVTALNTMQNLVDSTYTSGRKLVQDKEQLKYMDDSYKSYVDQLKNYRDQLDKMDTEQFDRIARLSKVLKDNNNINLQNSFPKFMQLREVMGSGFNSLVDALIVSNVGNIQNVTSDVIGDTIRDVLGSPAGAAVAADTLDLESFNKVVTDGSLMQYAEKDRDTAAGLHWNAVSKYVTSPNLIDEIPQDAVNNLGISMISVLERADELSDSDSLANASNLLASPAMRKMIDRLPEDQQNIVSSYVARSASEFMRRGLSDIEGATYDPVAGKLNVQEEQDRTAPARARFRAGQLNRVRRTKAEQINQKLENAATILVQYNPNVDNIKQAKEYIVRQTRPDLAPAPKEDDNLRAQAIKQNTTVEAIRERAELDARLRDFERRTELIANPNLAAVEQSTPEVELDPEMELNLKVEAFKRKNPEDAKEFTDEELRELLRGK